MRRPTDISDILIGIIKSAAIIIIGYIIIKGLLQVL